MKHALVCTLVISILTLSSCAKPAPVAAPVAVGSPFATASTLPYELPPFDRITNADFRPGFESGMAAIARRSTQSRRIRPRRPSRTPGDPTPTPGRSDGAMLPPLEGGNWRWTGALRGSPKDGRGRRLSTDTSQRFLQETPFAIVIYQGREHRAVFSNPKHDEMTSGRIVVGQTLIESLPELAGQPVVQMLDRVLATGGIEKVREIPARLLREGQLQDCWFDVTWQPTRDPGGDITGVLVTAIEVTDHVVDRRNLEVARAAAEAANHLTLAITANATLGLVMTDVRRHCTFMNPAAEKILGWTFAEVQAMDRPLHDVVHHTRSDGTPFPIDECPMDRALPQRLQEHGEEVLVRPDGTFYPVAFTASPILENGVPVGTVLELTDITERRALEEALREGERHVRQLVENLPELAWSARPDGHVDFYNRRWYEYTGSTFEQMEGWGWKAVVGSERVDLVLESWTRSLGSGEPFEMEFPLRRADGVLRWFLSRVRPLRDGQGRIVRWFGTNTDVDDSRRAAAERERLVADLQQALETRDEFLSVASHELRTPLMALQLQLQGAAHLLERLNDAENSKLLHKLAVANRQTAHLAKLVDGLLDVARGSLGRLRLDLADVDLVAIARGVVERYRPQAHGAGCSIDLEGDPVVVGCWDRSRMDQVVTNLITNAIKYGRGRPIGISARIAEGRARLAVADRGVGIRPEDQERIFARYERAVSSQHYGGLGLGLYIVRQIVEAHGGRIEVVSRLEEGATFTVSVPLRPDPVSVLASA